MPETYRSFCQDFGRKFHFSSVARGGGNAFSQAPGRTDGNSRNQEADINNIEFRDAGVLLTVKPRVNSGGLVVMKIDQEVSATAPTNIAENLTLTIQQRKINSAVAVQSGEAIVLGGLIRESKSQSEAGVPVLSQIPVLGYLFGSSEDKDRRTELVVLITPRAVQDPNVARKITKEFRRKMENIKPFFQSSSGSEQSNLPVLSDPMSQSHISLESEDQTNISNPNP